MLFGFQQPNFTFGSTPREIYPILRRIAQEAERLGFDSFWLMDHLMQIPMVAPPRDPILDCYTALPAIAADTKRIRLGGMMTCTSYRHPSLVAKMGASLDNISGGRFILGIGAGWSREEYRAYGYQFLPYEERVARLRDAVRLIKKMWTEEAATYEGEFYRVRGAICNPRPIQRPRPPVWIGGAGEKQTLRIVAEEADACNLFGSAEAVAHKLKVLREHCDGVGRDFDEIRRTILNTVVIGKTGEEVETKVKLFLPEKVRMGQVELTRDDLRKWMLVGTADQICQRLREYAGVGVQYAVVNFPDAHRLEPVQLFAEKVMPALS